MNESIVKTDARRRWLCIAYAFPPINRSGTRRTLGFVRHLDRLGWDATVVTVEPRDEQLDPSGPADVPPGAAVVRTRWIDPVAAIKRVSSLGLAGRSKRRPSAPDPMASSRRANHSPCQRNRTLRQWVSDLLTTPDSRIGWIPSAVWAGLREIRRRRPEVIFSTSPYMSAHLAAMTLGRISGVPWVADFRDPWCDNPFRKHMFKSLERWDRALERMVVSNAAHVVCNTSTQTGRFVRRYPSLAGRCTTIPNGFDRECIVRVAPIRIAPRSDFVLTHAGQFYGPRSPRIWFAALRRALARWPVEGPKLHLVLVGADTFEGRSLSAWANDMGVANSVHVLGPRTHDEALGLLAGSDALMLAGSDGPGADLQVPNKLYEYLALRKPILATCTANSPIRTILEQAKAEAITCDPRNEQALGGAIVKLATRGVRYVGNPWTGVDRFDRQHRAAELAALFCRLAPGAAVQGRVLESASRAARTTWPRGSAQARVAALEGGAASTATTPRTCE